MSTSRYHKAAKDGMMEVLKEATARDCNSRDEQRLTPTLYAAFYGNLEALRLLCGRGGDPNKADLFGSTALHLAAAQGHKPVVTFLVNFGSNIYATDIDGRTPQELAGMNNREEILRYLDNALAKLEASDKKKAKAMKEKAKKDSEKRIKEFNKQQVSKEKLEKKPAPKVGGHRGMIETIRLKMKSGSMSNLVNAGLAPPAAPRTSFSAIVGNGTISGTRKMGMGTVQRRVLASRNNKSAEDDFKVSEIEDGKRSVRALQGIRRDSEVLFNGTITNQLEVGRRGRLDGVFNETEQLDTPPPSDGMVRSISQPDFMHDLDPNGDKSSSEQGSIFVRPGMGSIAFRRSISNTFHGFYGPESGQEESSIGSGESYHRTNTLSMIEDEFSDRESSEDESASGPLERFLTTCELAEYLALFEEQKLDLQTLMLLSESDIKSLNLPLGSRVKLEKAINERKAALENPGTVTDSML